MNHMVGRPVLGAPDESMVREHLSIEDKPGLPHQGALRTARPTSVIGSWSGGAARRAARRRSWRFSMAVSLALVFLLQMGAVRSQEVAPGTLLHDFDRDGVEEKLISGPGVNEIQRTNAGLFLEAFSRGLAVTGFERTAQEGAYLLEPWP